MNILARENSYVLRGVAITAIMLHNFFHLDLIGFSKENEMSFSYQVSESFFTKFLSVDCNWIAELISFLGWTGVPAFVFLTGFGLMGKYSIIPNKWTFIKRNYLKLFWLLLPGFLFFFALDFLKGNTSNIFNRLIYLSMLQNLDYPDLKVDPGVYWYFSFTFQLYVFFALTRKWMSDKFLLILSLLTLFTLWLLGMFNYSHAFSIFRHCFTGWLPIFALGIYFSRHNLKIVANRFPVYVDLILSVLLLALMVLMNKNFHIWIFLPIISLYLYFIVSKLILRSGRYLTSFFSIIGKSSACIFVFHPIVREFVLRLYDRVGHLWFTTLIYFILTIIIASAYNKIYQLLLKRMVK